MKKRPINLDLFSIRFPITAIASVLHRASGVFLFFLIPGFLWTLQRSLNDPAFWDVWCLCTQAFWVQSVVWLTVSALTYHILAGFRHLMMDTGVGESLRVGRITAWGVLVLSVLLSLGLGYRIWLP